MTALDAIALARADEQTRVPVEARRVYCGCGCGSWWYREHREGRPRAYLNLEHYRRERNRRRRVH